MLPNVYVVMGSQDGPGQTGNETREWPARVFVDRRAATAWAKDMTHQAEVLMNEVGNKCLTGITTPEGKKVRAKLRRLDPNLWASEWENEVWYRVCKTKFHGIALPKVLRDAK